MADKTLYVPDLLEFHPCDTPRGMEYFNLEILTSDQQKRLNRHKTETIRDNQKYLFRNPEVRAVLQIIMKKLLLERPSHDLENFIGKYFKNNWESISEEVNQYVQSLPGKPKPEQRISIKDDKHVTLDDKRVDATSSLFSVTSEDSLSKFIVKEIVEEMVDRIHEHSQKRVRTSEDVYVIDDRKTSSTKESLDEDDELYFDLGLDFELDFSTYHEDHDLE